MSELDENYFGASRNRGKREARSAVKILVFGLLKGNWKSVCDGRAKLFKRGSDACNSRKDT